MAFPEAARGEKLLADRRCRRTLVRRTLRAGGTPYSSKSSPAYPWEATQRACPKGKIGWGGRIRTFTVLINSEVSYQLDHAPAGNRRRRTETARCAVVFAKKRVRSISLRYHEADGGPTAGS